MKKDPKMKRRQGQYVCVMCGGVLNDITVQHEDPFCRTDCARLFHGVELKKPECGVYVANTV